MKEFMKIRIFLCIYLYSYRDSFDVFRFILFPGDRCGQVYLILFDLLVTHGTEINTPQPTSHLSKCLNKLCWRIKQST